MRFVILHKTTPHWEAGAIPCPKLVAEVGDLIGALAREGRLLGADGLGASSHGARLTREGDAETLVRGPLSGTNELAAGFSAVRAASLEEAVELAREQARALGDVEIDVRPFTEPWEIGLAPEPDHVTTRRYMLLRKATAAAENGAAPDLAALVAPLGERHLASVNLAPSRRGRRYRRASNGTRVLDGPFTESKELIAGYVMIAADSLEDACRWAPRYFEVVGTNEVDVREVASTF